MGHSQNGTEALRSQPSACVISANPRPLAPSVQNLIANPRLKFEITPGDSIQLQIPLVAVACQPWLATNREPIAIFSSQFFDRTQRPPRHSRSPSSRLGLLATSHSSLVTAFLIVTLESELSATRTKQMSNRNPNRYKIALSRVDSPWRTQVSHLETICGLPPSACSPSSSCISHAPRLTWPRATHLSAPRSFDTCDPVGINLYSW